MVRRRARIPTSDSDEDEAITAQSKPPKKQKLALEELEEEEEEEEEPEEETGDAKPIGETVKVTGKGRKIKHHYKAFSFDDHDYELEDPVLLSPEDADSEKPYVAIIKMTAIVHFYTCLI
ncbi:hypothetical protein GIB67_008341 [Kingdonia uniflora]|uniref:Uncharacterized protein n=1 Tax=Kingdonia uniflora TaxID=39325 RepID=A0A7J7N596_9MAGN|nr:hypothetical protein GIB67_008341 [Kingdonia uniflora]